MNPFFQQLYEDTKSRVGFFRIGIYVMIILSAWCTSECARWYWGANANRLTILDDQERQIRRAMDERTDQRAELYRKFEQTADSSVRNALVAQIQFIDSSNNDRQTKLKFIAAQRDTVMRNGDASSIEVPLFGAKMGREDAGILMSFVIPLAQFLVYLLLGELNRTLRLWRIWQTNTSRKTEAQIYAQLIRLDCAFLGRLQHSSVRVKYFVPFVVPFLVFGTFAVLDSLHIYQKYQVTSEWFTYVLTNGLTPGIKTGFFTRQLCLALLLATSFALVCGCCYRLWQLRVKLVRLEAATPAVQTVGPKQSTSRNLGGFSISYFRTTSQSAWVKIRNWVRTIFQSAWGRIRNRLRRK